MQCVVVNWAQAWQKGSFGECYKNTPYIPTLSHGV